MACLYRPYKNKSSALVRCLSARAADSSTANVRLFSYSPKLFAIADNVTLETLTANIQNYLITTNQCVILIHIKCNIKI